MRRQLTLAGAGALSALWMTSTVDACEVATDPVVFGNVDLTRNNDATGRIIVDCPAATAFSIAIASTGEGENRLMRSGSGEVLRYRLYADANGLEPWGDGSLLGPARRLAVDTGGRFELVIYGEIPRQNLLPAGEYSDQPVVTLTY